MKNYGRASPPPDHVPPVTKVKGVDTKWHSKQVKVFIDTRAPRVIVLPASATHGKTAVIKFRVVEQLSPKIRVKAAGLDKAGRVVHSAMSQWLSRKGPNGWSFICRLKPGKYSVRITAFDLADNSSDPPGLGTLTVKETAAAGTSSAAGIAERLGVWCLRFPISGPESAAGRGRWGGSPPGVSRSGPCSEMRRSPRPAGAVRHTAVPTRAEGRIMSGPQARITDGVECRDN